jgi:hypothetical protein
MEAGVGKKALDELKVILGGDRAHKAGDFKKLLLCSLSLIRSGEQHADPGQ